LDDPNGVIRHVDMLVNPAFANANQPTRTYVSPVTPYMGLVLELAKQAAAPAQTSAPAVAPASAIAKP
jgi:hypothetical protein